MKKVEQLTADYLSAEIIRKQDIHSTKTTELVR